MTTETRKEPAAGAQATYRHEDATDYDAAWIRPRCSCGWADCRHANRVDIARRGWLEHATAAYQQEEAVWCVRLGEEYERPAFHWQPDDDDLADAEELEGDPVAGVEVHTEEEHARWWMAHQRLTEV